MVNSDVYSDLFEIDEIEDNTKIVINMVGDNDVHKFYGKDIIYISGQCLRYEKIFVSRLDNTSMQKVYSIPYDKISSMCIINEMDD